MARRTHPSPRSLALVSATLAACVEYGVNPSTKEPAAPVDTGAWSPDTGTSVAEALCRDALAGLATTVEVAPACTVEPVVGTLETTVEWSVARYGNFPEYGQAVVTPVVGRLVDTDGDGRVTELDVPSIVLVTDDDGLDGADFHGILRILSGEDGTEQRTISQVLLDDVQVYPYRFGGVALGDLDGDGAPEIVGIAETVGGPPGEDTGGEEPPDPDTGGGGGGGPGGEEEAPIAPAPPGGGCRPVAWRADGSLAWLADAAVSCAGHMPAIADLEGDGVAEVLVGAAAFDGVTGARLWDGGSGIGAHAAHAQTGAGSFAADLDGDGVPEVVAGRTVYTAAGAVACELDGDDGFPAAADLDGDGLGEVVTVGNGTLRVHDHACAVRGEWALSGGGNGGPPTIADFDADGRPEIGVATATAYTVYESDGTERWSMPVSDASSHSTGSSVHDFDGDGGAEVVYADETTLWVFDGATGAVRIEDAAHGSRTLHEYPVVADVDGDGLPEIVVPNGGGHDGAAAEGLYVLGSADGSWIGGRPVWNQHAYAVVNVDDDLGIPAVPDANWPIWNSFRSGDVNPVSGRDRADLVPIVGVCEAACAATGEIVVGVRVANAGTATARAGVPVVLEASDGTVVAATSTDARIDPGHASAVLPFVLDPALVRAGLRVRVDRTRLLSELVRECDEDNNDASTVASCPTD